MKTRILDTSLQRTAKEVRSYRLLKRLLITIGSTIGVLVIAVYIISVLYSRYGSFTVSVNKFNNLQYSISLSETVDFKNPAARLNCKAAADIWDIDGADLDLNLLGRIDGEDNGDNYMCYTFYLGNTGDVGVHVDYSLIMANATQNIDECIRVRLIWNNDENERQYIDFAKAKGVDENGQVIPEVGTTPFQDNYTITTGTLNSFMPGSVYKFTVVVWVEGPDDDCTDDKIGGTFKTDMKFSVSGLVEQTIEE